MNEELQSRAFRITFIVLNYNNGSDTIDCLGILRDELLADSGLSLVVVDNDSPDGSASILEEWCRTEATSRSLPVKFVRATGNLGYGPGNNLGMAVAKAAFDPAWYWILNNDASLTPDAAARMSTHLEETRADLVGMRIHTVGADPERDILGGGTLRRWQGRTVMSRPSAVQERLDFLSGSSFLVRAALVQQIGGFVTDHFLFWEEIDLASRARRIGASIDVVPGVVVNHVGGATSGARDIGKSASAYYYSTRSAVLFYGRHEGWVALALLAAARVALALQCLVRSNVAGARAVLRGIADGRKIMSGADI